MPSVNSSDRPAEAETPCCCLNTRGGIKERKAGTATPATRGGSKQTGCKSTAKQAMTA